MARELSVLQQLMTVIRDRQAHPSSRSYTTSLLAGGIRTIGDKVLEEANEVVDAAQQPTSVAREHIVHEAADLVYHLCVLLGHESIGWEEVEKELAARFGTSGLDEKAQRGED